jgi:outer membrane receptor protein involved in Fe transport
MKPPFRPISQAVLACAVSVAVLHAQNRSPAPQEEAVQLSPFVVSTTTDEGYRATQTLAGTRLNTSLMDTPAAISVLTKELLDDMGAQNTEEFMRMTTSTGFDLGNDQNANGSQWYDAPARIRGFSGATVTRDYFPWAMTTDVFNVERVDVNRGPNAVLFGVGAPGGVLNTSSKLAHLNSRKAEVAVSLGSWNKKRAELDCGLPLIRNKLALRLNTVVEDKEGWREFEFLKQKGVAGAMTYQPYRNTVLRAGVESRNVDQNRPMGTPNDLGGTRWLAAGAPLASNPLPGTNPAPTLLRSRNIEQVMYAPQLRAQPFRLSTFGIDLRPDLPGTQSNGFWDAVPGASTLAQGQVDDPYLGTIIPWKANLAGSGNTTSFNHTVTTVQFEQRLGKLSVELAFRHLQLWRDNRGVGADGLNGDPNPVLPGAYYADADSRVAAGRLPGTLLPDIGAPNPFAGKLYVEGQAQTRLFDWDQDQARATLGYELDLTKKRAWLGRHTFSGLFQRDRSTGATWVEREYNVAPNNNQLIDATTNGIYRRTYIDFSTPNGLHGAMDPWATPLDYPGVKSGWVIVGVSGRRLIQTDSEMIATQSKFLGDRLVVTAGWRKDEVLDWRALEDPTLKISNSTGLYSGQTSLRSPATEFIGNTRTFGVVALPWRWLGVSYNQSNSVNPQTAPNPYNIQYGSRLGVGKDFSLRFNLLQNKLWFNVNYYKIDDQNRQTNVFVQQQLQMATSVPAIIDALKATGQPLPASMVAAGVNQWIAGNGHTTDMSGKGIEIELVGAITPQWSISLNCSRNELGLSNIAPFHNDFIKEVTAAWKGNKTLLLDTPAQAQAYVRTRDNTPGRDFVVQPATINDTYEHAALLVAEMNRSDGQEPMQHQQDSFNVFTSYRFNQTAPRWFKGIRVGGGANYRSPPVIGYDAAQANAPIFGRREFLVNVMLGRSFKAFGGRNIDLQFNMQNLLGEDEMLPSQASASGKVLVYRYLSVQRSWSLKASHRF